MKSSIKRIVTHPGRAHLDDLLGVALGLAGCTWQQTVTVYRREPTPEELDDPSVLVLDIGKRYEPECLNFDHHQDTTLSASFVLLLNHFGIEPIFRVVHPWVGFASDADTQGPITAGLRQGISDTAALARVSTDPCRLYMLAQFEAFTQLSSPFAYELFHFGSFLLQNVEDYKTAQSAVDRFSTVVTVGGLSFLFFPDENIPMLEVILNRLCRANAYAGWITAARRNPGWRLMRVDDHPHVNFYRINGHPKVAFAHKGGFVAELNTRVDIPELTSLLRQCIMPDPVL